MKGAIIEAVATFMNQAPRAAPVQPLAEHDNSKPGASGYEAAAVVRHMAHELRQPLSTIESIAYYLDIVMPQTDAKARRQVEKLQQVVQQAGWIISDAVHFLQASPPSPQLIDLGEIVSDAVNESLAADAKTVRLQLLTTRALANMDPEQARHLLRNLLFFFRQITRPNPLVRIEAGLHEGGARILFETGEVDLKESDVAAMFEPFSCHVPAGSGLALASVRSIVDAHGGRLAMDCPDGGPLRLEIQFPPA
jgi:signal transduction histidine kinase